MEWAKLTSSLLRVTCLLALVSFVFALYLTTTGQLWVVQLGDLSSVGLGSVSGLYLLSALRFRSFGLTPMKSAVLALLFAYAFLQVYEIVYGLSFLPPITGTEIRTVVVWVLTVLPLVIMQPYLTFNWKTSFPLICAFAAVWVVWILYGFPQYYIEGFPIPPILKTSDPFHLSLWLNFGSKAILGVFFASLLEPLKLLSWRSRASEPSLGLSS